MLRMLFVMTWPVIRDVILFMAGLAGVIHETAVSATERPTLLLLFAAMMGLPAFLRADAKKSNGKNGNGA
jgi:hypothetical protein